ncbi:hypothetical protein ACFQ5N_05205 [Lutibacter holmesii]|uniref:Uncharacterized protein n=1 Tax=Lutibacter holmesii TaxID=1137985 RepID=A0ABW3WNY2_9FLAO
MKASYFKLIVALIILHNSNVYCQYVSPPSLQHKTVKKGKFDLSYKDLVGTIYIDNEYKMATSSISKTAYSTRYDAYHDQMEIEVDNKQYYLPKTLKSQVIFNNKTYEVYRYNNENSFFKIGFTSAKIKLLIKETIKLNQEVESNGMVAYKPKTLKRIKDQYFYAFENSVAFKLPKNKKHFYAIFKENSKTIQKFVKTTKLDLKNNQDLVKIFSYYTTLK